MSFAGFKKQYNKVNQLVSEKIGGAKGTELDDDYLEMERKTDVTDKLVSEIINKTQEFLQPNPATRAKLATQAALSKMKGQQRHLVYTQPESTLGDTLSKYGAELSEGSPSGFGEACKETGVAFSHLSEAKDSLEENVKQNFLYPLHQLQSKDIKEIQHHRKKTAGRRLDYDCKRRKKEKGVSEEELSQAEEKFADSKELTETAMFNLLSNDVEQISQVKGFVDALLEYHESSVTILTELKETLDKKSDEAAGKPKATHVPKRIGSTASKNSNPYDASDSNGKTGSYSFGAPASAPVYAEPIVNQPVTKLTPTAKALYDFEPENDGELGFKEDDIIELTQQIDENWFEGKIRGQVGYFPVNYVEVVNPL
ncbi:endophilin-A3-like [Watersipora subatra]|uniref:endophilin-A3-like n=1 Tax=Watersipora subatra TaxID=2589382 RepID=UPI00355B5B72